jgi:hypothetical protein
MKVKKETLLIFLTSLTLSFLTLFVERYVGINWDYHPDSVYYINNSLDFVNQRLQHSPTIFFFDGFYFFVVYFFNSKLNYVILFNIILYSYTNALIYKILKNKLNFNYFHLGTIVLLLSPYRLHLSTTLLKETLVIFFFISIFYSSFFLKIVSLIFLIFTRNAAIIYLFIFLRYSLFFLKNFNSKIFFLIIFTSLLFLFIYSDLILNYLNNYLIKLKLWDYIVNMHNNLPHKVRTFDNVENFSSLGNWGILIKAIFWPILLLTGTLIFFSPSIEFILISLAALINLMYCKIYLKSSPFELLSFLVLVIIATLTSGYSTFIRYSYPIITVIPIIIAINKGNKS